MQSQQMFFQLVVHAMSAAWISLMVDSRLLDTSTTALKEQCCSPHVTMVPDLQDPVAVNVAIAYGMSYVYHTYLYFYDSNANAKGPTFRHLAISAVGVYLLATCSSQPYMGLLVLSINYVLDLFAVSQDKLSSLLKVHHIATLTLLSWSYMYDFRNFGLIVLLAHDISDVPMFVIRLVRRYGASDYIQIPIWFIVVVTWFVYRIKWFGIVVVNAWTIRDVAGHSGTVCIVGMAVIWFLDLYWWLLTCNKGVQQFLRGSGVDMKEE